MTHQQILEKISAKSLVQNIEEDLTRLIITAITDAKNNTKNEENLVHYFLPKMLLRWNCVLKSNSSEVSNIYKQKTILILAVTLHKYGFADNTITTQAINAIDDLNKIVALSDDFFRKSDEIKSFIKSKPTELKRKPSFPDNTTFYRPKDIISIQLDTKYYAAYIHKLSSPNESPIIEFYDGIFDNVPTLAQLEKLKAKGQRYNDGKVRIAKFAVSGIKFLPDLANQMKLISACVEKIPSNEHLEKPTGLYSITDIFRLQNDIDKLFRE